MDTAEIVEDIWRKAQEFMHLSGTYMDDAHIRKADDLYQSLSRPDDCRVQSFTHLYLSGRPRVPMLSWNQSYRVQVQGATRIQGHARHA